MNEKMKLVANKTHQVHINVFQGNENTEYKDTHEYFTKSKNTEIVLEIMLKLFEAKAPIETITLEFKVPGNGMEQAKIMVDCGKMFLERFKTFL
jgi:hypothetical protein